MSSSDNAGHPHDGGPPQYRGNATMPDLDVQAGTFGGIVFGRIAPCVVPRAPPLLTCRCWPPSLRTAGSVAPSASLQQVAPRRSVHDQEQQQQQYSRPADRHPGFAGLASYRFRTADVNCRWLEAVVREAVVHLAQAPFLQVRVLCLLPVLRRRWLPGPGNTQGYGPLMLQSLALM